MSFKWNLLFIGYCYSTPSDPSGYRQQLLQPLTFLLLGLYFRLSFHLLCWATLLTCEALQLQKCPLLWICWQIFFSPFAFQALCGEFWFIINLISTLICFKWHFGAVFKSKDQKKSLKKNLSELLQPISFYQDKRAKPKCISELHFPDTDTKWWD